MQMHVRSLKNLQHSHDFSVNNVRAERRTFYVLILTAITMVVEILAGSYYGSMALLADGWHMGTHVAAFMIAIFAYRFARIHAQNPDYTFGTGKVSVLGGFASAIALSVVALLMLLESMQRIIDPHTIYFNEAILVATLGLIINIISAWLLKDEHHHHDHDHDHDAHHHDSSHNHSHSHSHHHDHNLKAAYMHVLADALTSMLAIIALLMGKYLGWNWLDPVMGIVGAIIITRWSYGLIRQTGPILLDASIDKNYKQAIKRAIENDSDNRIADIHIWKVSASHYAAIIALVTHAPKSADYYKKLLSEFEQLAHVTIEVNACQDDPCV